MDWNINPLAFLEFFVVIAFGVGWWILERHANRVGGGRKDAGHEADRDDDGPAS